MISSAAHSSQNQPFWGRYPVGGFACAHTHVKIPPSRGKFKELSPPACGVGLYKCFESMWIINGDQIAVLFPHLVAFAYISATWSNNDRYSKLQDKPPDPQREHPAHGLNMELDLQSLFGLLCTAVLIGRDPRISPPPPAFGLIYEGAIVQPR